ncbi:MAG: type I-F CRISPR-associated protein Csy1 [Methylococcales bacterium]|jgi:CRISPR-associated protein Csy1|nr:type I-F CRISPR-associated protein Csy1 [Methylococcales bacterium]MBT7411398.1 type I-F CRISPR-associated protein Csy1 [Methylococcales bacterium]
MLDPAIRVFFDERQDTWLKKNLKSTMEDWQKNELKIKCEEVFSFENWLPNAAKRSGQISISTHPCTFSHPSARKNKNGYVSSVINKTNYCVDGFLKTGNTTVAIDALGNAAALDVYKFLTLIMGDKETLLNHIENETILAKELLNIKSESYDVLRNGFLEMTAISTEKVTSSKIKQVFFPIDNGYHQLSILTHSGHLFELRKRIDTIRFSEQSKECRDLKRNGKFSATGFDELFNLTTIGYGGTKPQNISVLNNQNGGKAHVLLSIPPNIEQRNLKFPMNDFFRESFFIQDCKDILFALHKLFKTQYNNHHIREGRDYRIQEFVDRVADKMWSVRLIENQVKSSPDIKLKAHQKIWLLEENQQLRENTDDWLEKLTSQMTKWLIQNYEKLLGKQAIKQGEAERLHIKKIITDCKEALR